MKKVASIALVAVIAIVLAATAPSQAAGREGHGSPGGRPIGHFEGHRGPGGRHDFDRGRHPRVFIGVGPAFYWGPAYAYAPPPPAYWYYCPSYGAYYPNVPSCPEAWVPVPAE